KYFNDHGKPESDLNYVRWCVEMNLHQIQVACDELLHNFPMKWVGKLLRWIVFPFGHSYPKPSDSLYHKIVNAMLNPSSFRDRITHLCYRGEKDNGPIQRLDSALSSMINVEPIWKKFQNAIKTGAVPKRANFNEQMDAAVQKGLLTDAEARSLMIYHGLQKEV